MDHVQILDGLLTYGALGLVTAYFMVKDWQLNSKLQQTLSDFTVALNTLIGKDLK